VSFLGEVRKSFGENWTSLPFVIISGIGFIVAVVDFVFLQNLKLQYASIIGLILVIIGGFLRMKARLMLRKKAGFNNLVSTSRLQIIENHKLVKDGPYKYVRHPLYLGEILRNFGVAIIFSSGIGVLFILVGTILLLSRINMEEEMLLHAFGEEYKGYKKTKKLIPCIY
jgi:protein-S-isoprenylcysteine O-methyltransferase Ste14